MFSGLAQVYKEGTTMIVAYLFIPATFLVMGYIFIPRMQEFLGNMSVAESMGDLYGKKVEFITAVTGAIGCIGIVAVQFKIFGTLFGLFFPINTNSALLICSAIVILYSAFGGIRSVTITDVIQFITFSIFIPTLVFILVQDVDFRNVSNNIGNSHFTNFAKLFDYTDAGFYGFITLLFYFTFPNFAPEIYQRILIAKDINQIRQSFFIAFFICLAIVVMVIIVAIMIYQINPNIEPNEIVNYIMTHYLTSGMKGLTVIGIIAMIMSTADSNMNSSAVLLTDTLKLFKNRSPELQLIIARVISILLGLIAVALALSKTDLLSIILTTASFYFPIVNPPLMLAILGFRTSTLSVLIGMGAGFLTVIFYLVFDTTMDSIIMAMVANFIFLMGSHYLLKQQGGWVGVKEPEPLNQLRSERRQKINNFISSVKNFNLLTFCINHSPKEEKTYSFFGIFCFVTTLSTIYSINNNFIKEHTELIFFIYKSMLVLSTCFMLYPMWSDRLKIKAVVGIVWNISLIYILAFCSTVFVLLSHFGKLQLVIFTLNIMVLFILAHWRVAITMIFIGGICATESYKHYMGLESLNIMLSDVYFHLAYVFLLLSTVLITLLKPKQEYLEATEERVSELETETAALKRENGHAKREILNMAEGVEYFHAQLSKQKEESSAKTKKLASTIRELRNELLEVDNLKDEFLRNLQHESNTPLTAVLSKSNILFDSYDSLDSDTIKASIKDIINGSERLQSYVSNLVDTSKLTENAGSKLDKVIRVNLSKLVEERTKSFKKVFSDDKNKPRFKLDIEPDLMVECNEHYITQLLDNLISNADKYGENSVIEISLSKMNSIMVEFKITDHGIGIPKDEVYDIFKIFTNSSRTHSQAEGRGLGLALCHKVVEAHQGKIIAESDGEKGATFTFVIPFNYHFKGVKI